MSWQTLDPADLEREYSPSRDIIKGLVLLSGIYDLLPLINTCINDAFRFDEPAARKVSPQFLGLASFSKCLSISRDSKGLR